MNPTASSLQRLTPTDLQYLLTNINKFTPDEQEQLLNDLEKLEKLKVREKAQTNFLFFAQQVYEGLLIGYHHRIMAKKFEEIAASGGKRIIINMAPRHGKSLMGSYMFPAWFLGKFPQKKVIQASHTGELAVDFGRKVRNLIDSDLYQELFPGVSLSYDSKAAGRWSTNRGGEYYALGTSAAMAGKGADLLIIDDPVSEQEAKTGNPAVFDSTYEWYQTGPRQRLQPNASIIVIMTRWSKKDLTGRLVDNMHKNEGGDQWEVVELPMELPSGEPMWPEFWTKEDITKLKNTVDVRYWQSQYQQNPTSEEGALIKREWWRNWEDEDPPECSYIILSADTAHEKNTRADYSAFTVWGVFDYIDPNEPDRKKAGKPTQHIILLEYFKDRIEFPELKRKAFEMWQDWEPDSFIIEKKASGAPLIQELRRMGIPVQEFSPGKGQDKVARVNSVSDMFRSGFVWAPMTRWAEELINELAEFPAGETDDGVDALTLALRRYRDGGFVTLDVDFQEESDYRYNLQKAAAYY